MVDFRRFLVTSGIVAGWGILVIAGVRGIDGAVNLWHSQNEELHQAQDQLMRLKGWLEVERTISKRLDEVLGPFARLSPSDYSWAAVSGLQHAAQEEGMTIRELRPSELPRQGRQPAVVRLDAKLEGELQKVANLLRRFPDLMPGVQLENVQLVPQEGSRIQVLLRLMLLAVERS